MSELLFDALGRLADCRGQGHILALWADTSFLYLNPTAATSTTTYSGWSLMELLAHLPKHLPVFSPNTKETFIAN